MSTNKFEFFKKVNKITSNTDQEKKIKIIQGQNEKKGRTTDVVSRCIIILIGVMYNYKV